jgi:hypothetical protein
VSREMIEVGAFTWNRVLRLYEPDATARQHCESEGLRCPQEVFTQLFSEKLHDEDFAVIVRRIDYSAPLACRKRSGQPLRAFANASCRRVVV